MVLSAASNCSLKQDKSLLPGRVQRGYPQRWGRINNHLWLAAHLRTARTLYCARCQTGVPRECQAAGFLPAEPNFRPDGGCKTAFSVWGGTGDSGSGADGRFCPAGFRGICTGAGSGGGTVSTFCWVRSAGAHPLSSPTSDGGAMDWLCGLDLLSWSCWRRRREREIWRSRAIS